VRIVGALLIAFTVSGSATLGHGQTPPAPPARAQTPVRDTTKPVVGTATLGGTVVADDASAKPMRRVAVTINNSEVRVSRSTITDASGTFIFRSLPAGRYTVSAQRLGYVGTAYGAKRPGQPGGVVSLADGQKLTDITMRMMRGAVLTGTLRSVSGKPAAAVSVTAIAIQVVNGERRHASSNGNATTDDHGVYRIYGLAPGDYLVYCSNRFGGSSDMHQLTADELKWANQQLQTGRPGDVPSAAVAAPMVPPPNQATSMSSYALIYFPGTADPSAASVITLRQAEERAGIDFQMQLIPTARVSGTIVDAEGGHSAQNVLMYLVPRVRSASLPVTTANGSSNIGHPGPDGKFLFPGLPPGQYVITARAAAADGAPGAPATGRAGRPPAAPAMNLWALAEVTVEGRDVANVEMRLAQGMVVSGRVVFEGTATPPEDLTRVQVRMTGAQSDGVTLGVTPKPAEADGRFTLDGVTPSLYRVSATVLGGAGQPNPWVLKSAMLNGKDTQDFPLEVRPNEDVPGLVLTFTDQPTEVSGMLQDSSGKPAPGYFIVVLSTDRQFWQQGSRRVVQTRPASDGKFTVRGLPPGEYFICALTELDPTLLYDPAFLEQVASASYKITLAEGEKKTQDLKLAGGGP
jgi:hypothetical protein